METERVRIILGDNIRTLRQAYGLSRKSLAKLIRVPVNRLKRLENGDTKAKLYDFHLLRVARVFDVSVDSLFEEENDTAQGRIQ